MQRWLSSLACVVLVSACSAAPGGSTTLATSDSTAIQIPPPGALTTTTRPDDPGASSTTTAPDPTPDPRTGLDLDLAVTVDGVEYALPTSMCSADPGVTKSTLNQMMLATRQAIDRQASGWPTTTANPDPTAGEQLERLAIATTAVAVRLDLLGIWQSRIRDINEAYVDEEAGVVDGPIDRARLDRWISEAEPLVAEIEVACSG